MFMPEDGDLCSLDWMVSGYSKTLIYSGVTVILRGSAVSGAITLRGSSVVLKRTLSIEIGIRLKSSEVKVECCRVKLR